MLCFVNSDPAYSIFGALAWIFGILPIFSHIAKTEVSPKCRVPNDIYLDPKTFASFTCGQCFYYTFLQTSKRYKTNYMTGRCLDGSLICDKRELHTLYLQFLNDQTTPLLLPNASQPATKLDWSDAESKNTFFNQNCNCQTTKHRIFNLDGYGNGSIRSLKNLIMEPRLPFGFAEMTEDCCKAAEECCEKMLAYGQKAKNYSDSHAFCPLTWDGWQCWPRAEGASVSTGVCPYYLYDMATVKTTPDPSEYFSKKTCTSDGHWWKFNQSDVEWTDYRECATARLHEESVKYFVGVGAFALSVIFIIPAVVIFSVYRSLRVDRITIHKHLLISFLLNGIFHIFNSMFFVAGDAYGASLLEENDISCRLAFLVQLRYLRTSNYMWMLCEGLYLYKLLIDAFSESRSLKIFYLLGWVFPIIPTVIYALLKQKLDNEKCWIVSNVQWIQWISHGPCILSLLVNVFLMVSIMRVLITKLRQTSANEPAQYRKAVRATLVLLPVFGLHFFLTIYKMEHLLWYEVINKLLDGFQGLFVAIIICYSHSEVIELLRKSWKDRRNRRKCERERIDRMKKSSSTDHSANNALL